MKAITLNEVQQAKANDIRYYEANRQYAGNAETDQRIQYVINLSDVDYMNMMNEVARKEVARKEAAKDKKSAISAERKATGMTKKQYRAEYDRLMAEYKAGNDYAKYEAKKIQKFAF